MVASNNTEDTDNSCGIAKITDCRLDESGRQLYKVRWVDTWEPGESLVTCQHLIDEFWSFVNRAKVLEKVARQGVNVVQHKSSGDVRNFHKLSEDDKTDVQRLIARTNATSVGNPGLQSPSNMLMHSNQQQNNIMVPTTPTQLNYNCSSQTSQMNASVSTSSPGMGSAHAGIPHKNLDIHGHQNPAGHKGVTTNIKHEPNDTKKTLTPSTSKMADTSASTSTLKYIENFSNPYVKIIVVCSICNKEQSIKFSNNWKRHYLSHVSDTEKPHKCPMCPKAYVTAPQLKKHMKSHEKVGVGEEKVMAPKVEPGFDMY